MYHINSLYHEKFIQLKIKCLLFRELFGTPIQQVVFIFHFLKITMCAYSILDRGQWNGVYSPLSILNLCIDYLHVMACLCLMFLMLRQSSYMYSGLRVLYIIYAHLLFIAYYIFSRIPRGILSCLFLQTPCTALILSEYETGYIKSHFFNF